MRNRMTRAFALVTVLAVVAVGSSAVRGQGGQASQRNPGNGNAAVVGHSLTLLPNGRYLVVGGTQGQRVLPTISLWDPQTDATSELPSRLNRARTRHTATLLADGRVLILGGTGNNGRIVPEAEIFDPSSGRVEVLDEAPFSPRARHTTTVLGDGRVLVVGGTSENAAARDDAELWDPVAGITVPIPGFLSTPRAGHAATVLSDGAVRIVGGAGAAARAADEVYDPVIQTFVPWTTRGEATASYLAASNPADTEADVPTDVVIGVRFSRRVRVATLDTSTVILRAGDTRVDAALVPVEDGRLLFVRPARPLSAGQEYVLAIDGAVDVTGERVQPAAIRFSTLPLRDDVPTDDEEWNPSASNRRNWRSGRGDAPWRKIPPLQAPPGVTALAGQVLLLNGQPLANVTLSIGGVKTESDRTGRFLLTRLPTGRQVLRIDGRSATRGQRAYGIFHVAVQIRDGRTTVLTYTIWMPTLDRRNAVALPSPTRGETVVTTPRIPGLELRIPAGTVIRDIDGQVVRSVSITAIPVDRPPFPLPAGTQVPIYFTVQPGGAHLQSARTVWPAGARLIYPNYWDYQPGRRVDFWQYDAEAKGWFVYGKGTVTRDARQIVPDEGVVLYEFTGAMIASADTLPAEGPEPGDEDTDGDPVDLSTGQFVLDKTDLVVPDVFPIRIGRTYRPQDTVSRAFGLGSFLSYDLFLAGDHVEYSYAVLVLPNGGRIRFERTEPGTDFMTTFVHTATPSEFYGSRLTWDDFVGGVGGWNLVLKSGLTYVFPDSDGFTDAYRAAVMAIRDRYGNTLTISRNATTGRITSIVSPNGRWVRPTYDANGRITRLTDNINRRVEYEYDVNGRLWKVTDAAGGVTEYGYDTEGRLETITDPREITYLTNVYDTDDRVVEQTLADEGTYLFDYTLDNDQIVQTDVTNPRGVVRRVTFNAEGYRLTDTQAHGTGVEQTIVFERQPGTQLVLSTTDELDRTTEYTYNAAGNVTHVTRLAGTADEVTTVLTYEPTFQQVKTITDPLDHTVTFGYDGQGNLTSITNAESQTSTRTYDGAGRLTSETDAVGGTSQFSYVGANLSQVTDPLGRTTLFEYDGVGRLLRSTSPTGQVTTYQYSPLNLVTRVVDPLGGQTVFTYDGNGNLESLTDAKNQTTTYTYDVMDRVETRTDPLERTETYAYDLGGNLLTVTDRLEQVTTRTYDELDRPATVAYDDTSTTTYTYDLGDRLTEIEDSISGTITRAWDGLDQLLEEETPQGTVTYTYDDGGRRSTMTAENQSLTNYSYDDANRLLALTRDTQVVGMSYDEGGRRTALSLPNGVVVTYSYDIASHLTRIDYEANSTPLGNLTYSYDGNGQVTGVGGSWARTGLPSALASATYDAGNQLTNWGGVTITHDANGNMTGDGSRTLTWNARNQLVGISGGASASFVYDGLGRRQEKTVSSSTTGFLFDGRNPVQEQREGGDTDLLTGLGLDEWLTQTTPAGTFSFLTGPLGSTVGLVDDQHDLAPEFTYQPFGAHSATGGPATALTFTGREDDGTGLMHYRARYYHPGLQRFVSEDPLGLGAGDPNLYAYVFNAPTQFTDPTGEFVQAMLIGCAIGGGGAIAADWLAGRKIDWSAAGMQCLLGAGASRIGAIYRLSMRAAAPFMEAVGGAMRSVFTPASAGAAEALASASAGRTAAFKELANSMPGQALLGLFQGGMAEASPGAPPPAAISPIQGYAQLLGQMLVKLKR